MRRPMLRGVHSRARIVLLLALVVGGTAGVMEATAGAGRTPRSSAPALTIGPPAGAARSPLRPRIAEFYSRVEFYSRALHRRADYLLYVPHAYRPGRHLPVFYLLHGMPGRPRAFTVNAQIEPALERLIARRRVQPMILVFPDGRIGGRIHSDSEWANTPAGRYDSYVADVVRDVDHRFGALPFRRDRAVAGLSAGAYGAMNVALHHLSLFASVQVWSGYFTQTRTGVFAHASYAQLLDNSPIDVVRRLRRTLRRFPLRAFLYVGKKDASAAQTPLMAAALARAGADVHFAVYPGVHSWKLWRRHLERMLILAGREMRSGRARWQHPVHS
ncbi:MAG: alpha/beta hydrolase-fold protein [Actinomycetota bacterium]|nr:alpha/beta hydrolase-fold protein [Actinomycetota bacterium]